MFLTRPSSVQALIKRWPGKKCDRKKPSLIPAMTLAITAPNDCWLILWGMVEVSNGEGHSLMLSHSAGTDFSRQNLTSADVRF